MDTIKKAREIIEKFKFEQYIEELVDHWCKHPPQGHGFWHAIDVGVNSFEIAKDNKYPHPEYVFLGGLFHDIHRPATGEGGEEDQREGATFVEEIFNRVDPKHPAKQLIIDAILTHDNWIGEQNPPLFSLYLSYGDKASFTKLLSDSYVWASNKYSRENHGKASYTDHLQLVYLFIRYQQRAWSLFYKHPIKSANKAIDQYIEGTEYTFQKYQENPDFDTFYKEKAAEARALERNYLESFEIPESKILKLLSESEITPSID